MLNFFTYLSLITTSTPDAIKDIDWVHIFAQIQHILTVVNDWLASNIGIVLFKLLKAAGGFFIWILEFIVTLVKEGLAYLH